MAKKKAYDNDSISSLKGADRVRKRPGVIFGSDGLEGCEHAVFEILSNAIDEARAGFGRVITVTRFQDRSIQVEDQGRGCPVDWNEKEGRYNWELVFCEMYAGGKYDPTGENYEFSLGLNGLGSCATQYASRYMDVTVCRDGNEYKLHFQRGEIVGQMEVTPLTRKKTGTTIRWLPDLEVFTDIDIPLDYYQDVMKRQAVVNAGVTFRLRDEVSPGRFETQDFLYENGIRDYLAELAGDDPITRPVCWEAERQGRDRADKPEYKVKLNIAWCFSNRVHLMEHYHNSSFLEHGGSPDKATRLAFVAALDKYLRENNKYTKGESKITFPDVQECLLLVSSNFSTQTSYENQHPKKQNPPAGGGAGAGPLFAVLLRRLRQEEHRHRPACRSLRPGVYPRPPVLLHRAGALPAEKLHGGSAAPPAGWHHGRGLRRKLQRQCRWPALYLHPAGKSPVE